MICSEPPKVVAGALYGTMETCKILGVHRSTLRRYVNSGALNPVPDFVTGRYLYPGREISRFWLHRGRVLS